MNEIENWFEFNSKRNIFYKIIQLIYCRKHHCNIELKDDNLHYRFFCVKCHHLQLVLKLPEFLKK